MANSGTSFAQRERSALCDLLSELGPDAPTLCEGWRSADLAAHLVTREHRPDGGPGLVLPFGPLVAWTDRVRRATRDTTTWDNLVTRVRSGPPAMLRPFDKGLNTIEYFVHHEDLRRAQEGWEPRQLAADDEALLWQRLRAMKRLLRSPAGRIEAPGQAPLLFPKSTRPGTLRGPVGELTLWLLGRRGVARVEGPEGPA
jgi:uncharacterized protein (TIGR03085 family)